MDAAVASMASRQLHSAFTTLPNVPLSASSESVPVLCTEDRHCRPDRRDLPTRSHINLWILRNPPSHQHGHSNCVDRNFRSISNIVTQQPTRASLRQALGSRPEIDSKIAVMTSRCIHQTMRCVQVCRKVLTFDLPRCTATNGSSIANGTSTSGNVVRAE
jgi:hypothetical protein